MRKEIAGHGFGISGEWVGFPEAARQWEAEGARANRGTTYSRNGKTVRVSVPE